VCTIRNNNKIIKTIVHIRQVQTVTRLVTTLPTLTPENNPENARLIVCSGRASNSAPHLLALQVEVHPRSDQRLYGGGVTRTGCRHERCVAALSDKAQYCNVASPDSRYYTLHIVS
jgi:hypothetical protein